MSEVNKRMSRYSSIAPLINQINVHIVGVGSVGRRVATELASMGVANMWVYDFDHVDETNLGTQGWKFTDVGRPKVQAAKDHIYSVNPHCELQIFEDKFKDEHIETLQNAKSKKQVNVVFACLDSMEGRKHLYHLTRDHCDLYIDTRMAAEQVRVINIVNPEFDTYYSETLFADEEAVQERCTARSTAYAAMIVAGIAINKLTMFLRRQECVVDELYNISNSDITVVSETGVSRPASVGQ